MASKSKRPGEEDKAASVESTPPLIQQMLSVDTDELAANGRNNVAVLADLDNFCIRLRTSIAAVRKAQDDDENNRKAKERAIQAAQDKNERAGKTKLREPLVAAKRCFKCNIVKEELIPCVEYKHGDGVSGDGVLFCDGCMEKVMTHSCASCNSFLHEEIGENSCCAVDCLNECYKCNSCEEVFCRPCAEEDGDKGQNCDCGDFYCNDCADENIETDCCYQCNKEEICCGNCTYNDSMGRCEGGCNALICDACVRRLTSGNDARLCGDCEYDCENCDMSDGYYNNIPRWK